MLRLLKTGWGEMVARNLSPPSVILIGVFLASIVVAPVTPFLSPFFAILLQVVVVTSFCVTFMYTQQIAPALEASAKAGQPAADAAPQAPLADAKAAGPKCRACGKPMPSAHACECGKVAYCSAKCRDADYPRHRSECPNAQLPVQLPMSGVRVSHFTSLFPADKTAGLSVKQVATQLIRPRSGKHPMVAALALEDAGKKHVKAAADVFVVCAEDAQWDDVVAALNESDPSRFAWIEALNVDQTLTLPPKAYLPALAKLMATIRRVEVVVVPASTFKNAMASWQCVQAAQSGAQVSARLTPQARAELRARIVEGAPFASMQQAVSGDQGSDAAMTAEAIKTLEMFQALPDARRTPARLLAEVIDDVVKEAAEAAPKASAGLGIVTYSKGLLALARGEQAKARTHFVKAADVWLQQCSPAVAPLPAAARTMMGVAGSLINAGAAASAHRLVEQVVELDAIAHGRDSLRVARDLVSLAECLLAKGSAAEAKAAVETSLAVATREGAPPDEVAQSRVLLGTALLRIGQAAQAVDAFQAACALLAASPKQLPAARLKLAGALAAAGRRVDALAEYAAALPLAAPEDEALGAALEDAARLARADGRAEQAAEWGSRAVRVYRESLGFGHKTTDRAAREWAPAPSAAGDEAAALLNMLRAYNNNNNNNGSGGNSSSSKAAEEE